jgi:hypothetical protein
MVVQLTCVVLSPPEGMVFFDSTTLSGSHDQLGGGGRPRRKCANGREADTCRWRHDLEGCRRGSEPARPPAGVGGSWSDSQKQAVTISKAWSPNSPSHSAIRG